MATDQVVRLIIKGRVQGVGFRAFVEQTARAHGVHGWVRNRHGGNVEAVLGGESSVVAAAIAAIWIGPPAGRVDAVTTEELAVTELEQLRLSSGFSILATA